MFVTLILTINLVDDASLAKSQEVKSFGPISVISLSFSPDSKRLAIAGEKFSKPIELKPTHFEVRHSSGALIKVFEMATGNEIFQFTSKHLEPNSVRFLEDGAQLAVGFKLNIEVSVDNDRKQQPTGVFLWDLKTNRKLGDLAEGSQSSAFSANAGIMASGVNLNAGMSNRKC
jgi:dipeptidyl aminopeptidase/acylaminoacyl peptidase